MGLGFVRRFGGGRFPCAEPVGDGGVSTCFTPASSGVAGGGVGAATGLVVALPVTGLDAALPTAGFTAGFVSDGFVGLASPVLFGPFEFVGPFVGSLGESSGLLADLPADNPSLSK